MSQATQKTFQCAICQAPQNFGPEVLERMSLHCSRCHLPLKTTPHSRFRHLDPAVYKHPFDVEATQTLEKLPGMQALLKKITPLAEQSYAEAFFAANGLRVNEKQSPALYAKLVAAAQILGLNQVPNLYLSYADLFGSLGQWAYSGGIEQPFIVLSPQVQQVFDARDQLALLARELGHIHLGHMQFKLAADTLALMLQRPFKKTPLETISDNLTLPIQQNLLSWRLKANLSADRTAMLVLQDERAVFSLLMKLAGGSDEQASLEAFVQQAHQLNLQMVYDWLDTYWQQFLYNRQVDSFATWRAAEMLNWSRQERKKGYGYQDIVKIFAA